MAKANWVAIKTEYITTNKGIRKLAEEFGASVTQIAQHCREEKWVDARAKHSSEKTKAAMAAKVKAEEKKAKADAEARAMSDAEILSKAELACMNLLDSLIREKPKVEDYSPTMKQAYGKTLETTIKMLKDLRGILSPAEVERIDAMHRELAIKEEEHRKFMEQDTIQREPIKIEILNDELEKYAK